MTNKAPPFPAGPNLLFCYPVIVSTDLGNGSEKPGLFCFGAVSPAPTFIRLFQSSNTSHPAFSHCPFACQSITIMAAKAAGKAATLAFARWIDADQ
ncbi:MAG TPA: hypothetical protein PK372_07755, partial [Rugosibacter sp.]|nr:hypothetical protein [Rugosibacter sp.]